MAQADLHEFLFMDDCVRERLDDKALAELVLLLLDKDLPTEQLIEEFLDITNQ